MNPRSTRASKVSATTRTWRELFNRQRSRRGARLIPVRLVCKADEFVRRIQSGDRAAMLKCTDPADAIHKSRHHAVLDWRLPGTLTLDVTRLTPEQSVEAILAHIKSVGR